eukprot:4190054-Pleurochrysis_carterae.AAC.2
MTACDTSRRDHVSVDILLCSLPFLCSARALVSPHRSASNHLLTRVRARPCAGSGLPRGPVPCAGARGPGAEQQRRGVGAGSAR